MKYSHLKTSALLLALFATLALAGCSSGGDSSDHQLVEEEEIAASFLIVDAGQDKDVAAGDNVSLHGVVDTDGGDASVKILWEQTGGSDTVLVNDADTFNPTFSAPHVQVKTLLTFNLHVSSGGLESNDTVVITVLATTLPQVLPPSTIVTHSGSTVTVHSGTLPSTQTLTHLWTQVSGPTVTLQTSHLPSTTFVAPSTTAGAAVVLQHVVTSTPTGGGAVTHKKTKHTVQVVPKAVPLTQISVTISPPTTVYETLQAALHASASGGDGNFTYTWSVTRGTVILDTSDPQNPTFTPSAVTADEPIELELVVKDGSGQSVTKRIPITIRNVILSIKTSADALAQSSHSTHLHAAASETPALNPITYQWSEIGGTSATITDATTDNPAIQVPKAGSYTFEVTATDSAGNSAKDRVNIDAVDGLTVDAGKDYKQVEDVTATLHGLSTGAFGASTIKWTRTKGCKSVTIKNPNSLNPSFTTPIVGAVAEDCTFKMEVSDAKGRTQSDTVTVTVTPVLPTVILSAPDSMPVSSKTKAHCRADGGVGKFTFAWEIAPVTDATLGNPTADGLTASNIVINAISSANSPVTLTCTVTDAYGRKVSATYPVSIYQVPSVSTLNVIAIACSSITENDTCPLSAFATGGTTPYKSYEWTFNNAPAVGAIDDPTAANTFFKPFPIDKKTQGGSIQQTIKVKVTDSNVSPEESTDTISISISDVPVTAVVKGPDAVVAGNTLTLTADVSGGDGNYTCDWFKVSDKTQSLGTDCHTFAYNTLATEAGSIVNFLIKVTNTVNGVKEVATSASHPVTINWPPLAGASITNVDVERTTSGHGHNTTHTIVVRMTCNRVGGSPPIHYQWTLPLGSPYYKPILNTTSAALVASARTAGNKALPPLPPSGDFKCEVTDGRGNSIETSRTIPPYDKDTSTP